MCLLAALVAAPAANAASTTQILRDCADDGVLQGSYSPSELRRARQNIPTDTDEYTDCRDVLARAAVAGVAARGGGSGASGGAGGTGALGSDGLPPADPNTPEGRQIVGEAGTKPPPGPMTIDGRSVIPGTASLAANGVRNDLPTGLLVALILLGACALATLLPPVRRVVVARFKR
jgi:hypothetical protein